MDIDALIREARDLGREAFVRRYPHLFLLSYEGENSREVGPAQFFTDVAQRGAPAGGWSGVLHVLPVVKSAKNPYSDRISIGRARNCDVVLRDPSVSKLHAHVRRDEAGGWSLHDAGSHNGTSIGGRPLARDASAPLQVGDSITLGALVLQVADAEGVYNVVTRLSQAR
ncbi:MAG TPA: FHA domain-containing protein [Polyangia bacterium]|nr:FHA domain-containing protein [Polyangia bacterium]